MRDLINNCVQLDTSYSTFQTESSFTPVGSMIYSHNIRFIPIDNIDYKMKKTNIENFNYYLKEYLPKINYDFVKDLYIQDYNKEKMDPEMEFDKKFVFPIEIFEKYGKLIENRNNEGLLFYAEKQFLKWYHKIKKNSSYIMVKKDEKKHLKKLITRFDKKYQKMIQNRMNWLMWEYGNENACSITLTLNPANFRKDKFCMWETINILLNEFMTELKKYLKSRKKGSVKYIRCIEAMKGTKKNWFVGKGNPHIHICLFGIKYIPKSIITKYWPYGFNYVNSTAKNQKVRYPIHYITKYITKTYTENDVNNTLNQSLVWFFNKKSFEHSRSLVYPMHFSGSGEWNFEYYVIMDPMSNDLDEMNLIFEVENNLLKHPPPVYEMPSMW